MKKNKMVVVGLPKLIDLGDLISGVYYKKCATDKSATFSEVWVPLVMRGVYSNMHH
jgi:hypothetical protein